MPVNLSAVRALEDEANSAPKTGRTVTLPRRSPTASSSPTAPMEPLARAPLPEGRVPKTGLRLIFGAIALAIIGWLYYKFRG